MLPSFAAELVDYWGDGFQSCLKISAFPFFSAKYRS